MPSLGNDLASIRKEQNLSIDDIHKSTKIPLDTLHRIEDDSIFEDLEANKTYIRSYIRTYARELGIEDKLIIRALDQVENRNYQGILHDPEDPKSTFTYDDSSEQPDQIEEKDIQESPSDLEAEYQSEETSMPSELEQEDESKDQYKQSASPRRPQTNPPSVHSVNWADMGKKFNTIQPQTRIWGGAVIIFLLVAVVVFIIWFQYEEEPTPIPEQTTENTETTQEAAPSDSLQLDLAESGQQTDPADEESEESTSSLPDTLTLGIYAAYDVLEPVRVQADLMTTLNPYWIEEGTVFEFEFADNIQIRGQYDDMVLLLNGHVIEDFQSEFLNAETGGLQINREAFEGDSKWLQPPPDSLGNGIPQPENIQDRPTYNN